MNVNRYVDFNAIECRLRRAAEVDSPPENWRELLLEAAQRVEDLDAELFDYAEVEGTCEAVS